jgi:hypothetical protein
MSDISFTEMGKALDAATQIRESGYTPASGGEGTPSNSVSSESKPSVPTVSSGSDASPNDGKGPSGSSPAVPTVSDTGSGNGSQPPKKESSPSSGADTKAGPNGTVADGQGKPSAPSDDKAGDERRKWNHWQAQKRIAAREAKRRQFEQEKARLQRERDAYADEQGEYHDPNMVKVKEDQLKELQLAQIREAQAEWERDAYELFSPEDAAVFVEDSKKLGDWLNRNEPELLSYLDRPYGKHLLKGWMDKIAKNKAMADQWESLNSYEKYRLIDKYYNEIEKFGKDYAEGKVNADGTPKQTGTQQVPQAGASQTTTPPVNAPVPNSGRDTNTIPPSNNFGLMLQEAMNKRNIK